MLGSEWRQDVYWLTYGSRSVCVTKDEWRSRKCPTCGSPKSSYAGLCWECAALATGGVQELERERVRRAKYTERLAIRSAYVAFENMLADWRARRYGPVRVHSTAGMLRLVSAVFGQKAKVRWSWPADVVARAHLAEPIDPDAWSIDTINV